MSRAHIKQTFRLDAGLVRRLEDRARQRGTTKTEVVEAALSALLLPQDQDRAEALLIRRLDRLVRLLERLAWHTDLTNETLAVFVRHWLTSTTPLPANALAAAQATGKRRWEGFVDALAKRMDGGAKFAAELSRNEDQSDPARK
ncbi:CopG family transcriptional regulator [Sphingopyxis sp. USTB-05]|uniref:CopG family transcriptional regulator n=1 Tax=Sphingopyxis sp. USTB-05 TaxID=2830667 RepID=UPI002078E0B4|nr:CopG family transcriptional regulator [Sphingopyxis sp. USTB-05]USI79317.1 CopG family transcriptional regulator [Sphingopyxis sp. USTB-05]